MHDQSRAHTITHTITHAITHGLTHTITHVITDAITYTITNTITHTLYMRKPVAHIVRIRLSCIIKIIRYFKHKVIFLF